jgi:serine/threonine-protein kinase RsbT
VKDTDRGELPIQSEADIVIARRAVRDAATTLGFGLTDVTRIVTAASELTRNVYLYAKSGIVRWRSLDVSGHVGLELVFEDHGPGIPDIDRALQDGFTTGSGLGLGLGGAKRLSNEFEIDSRPGEGTRITIARWKL